MHGGYHDIDAGPSKTYLIENRDFTRRKSFLGLAVAKRPAEELYDIQTEPGCLNNLADDPAYADVKRELWKKLAATLRETGDPRMEESDIFESYRRYSPLRYFPIPEWAETGNVPTPNWINR
jgi:uncharacterized sulfatase